MRRIKKDTDSVIVAQKLSYRKGNNSHLSDLLAEEQHNICAYTEEYLGRADKAEIEHFNPNLKFSGQDGYENWFLVKAQWNNEKGRKKRWGDFQPLMHPTAQDFETRILYDNGRYILADENDVEARNLRAYLKLDDEELAKQRVNYIRRLKSDLALSGLPKQVFIDARLRMNRNDIYYIRAVEEELNINVNFDLLKTT